MKKMMHVNKQLELPVLMDLNSRGGNASSVVSVAAQPVATCDARSQPGSHKEASSSDLSIYQAISASYFAKRN